MKKIAVLIDGNIYDRKGMVNAALQRIKYLKMESDYQVECFSIMKYGNILSNSISHYKMKKGPNLFSADGLDLKIIWIKFYIIDSILSRLGISFSVSSYLCKNKIAKLLSSFDLLSVHSFFPGEIALLLNRKYSIPFVVTWHGSDIHTYPFNSTKMFVRTKKVIEKASVNFYVCKTLYETSLKITKEQNAEILYNGINSIFGPKSLEQRNLLRQEYDVNNKKVIAFVGNIIPVKNISSLPQIFDLVYRKYCGSLIFWIVGDGQQKNELYINLSSISGLKFKMWGNQNFDKMPSILNCVDVLVLPSINEGLPLILGEAIKCGANAVGSDVGGIPEVLDKENCFVLDKSFEENISNRIVDLLEKHEQQKLRPELDWSYTAKKENSIYSNILK